MESNINIIIIGGTQNIFETIFPEKKDFINKEYGTIQERIYFSQYSQGNNKFPSFLPFFRKIKTVKWFGYKYPELFKENHKKIIKDIYNTIKESNNKNYIIIKYGKQFFENIQIIINKLNSDKLFSLFIFDENDIIDEVFFKKVSHPQFINYIHEKKDPNNPNIIYHKIISYIWEKDCYFNERGNQISKFLPANLLYRSPRGFIFCNILLTGESRAGKSSFLNRIFNKMVSIESGEF